MRSRDDRLMDGCAAILTGMWAAGACAADVGTPPAAADPVVAADAACRLTAVGRRPIRLEGRDVYVEPQAFLRARGGLLLAGSPLYEWSPGDDGLAESRRDRILGIVVRADGVDPVPLPPGLGQIGDVRARVRPDGTVAWILAEVTEFDYRTRADARITYAELGPVGWSPPEWLRAAEDEGYRFAASSELVAEAGALVWYLPVGGFLENPRVVRYEREGVRWSWRTLDSVGVPTSGTERTAAVAEPGAEAALALVGREEELDRRYGLRLLTIADPVTTQRVRVAGEDESLFDPELAAGPAGIAMSWVAAPAGERPEAWGALADPAGPPTPFRLDEASDFVLPLVAGDGHVLWLVRHLPDEPQGSGPRDPLAPSELRIYRHRADDDPALVATMVNPFTGPFAALPEGASGLVVVGPELNRDPTRATVRSLLLRMSVSCT